MQDNGKTPTLNWGSSSRAAVPELLSVSLISVLMLFIPSEAPSREDCCQHLNQNFSPEGSTAARRFACGSQLKRRPLLWSQFRRSNHEIIVLRDADITEAMIGMAFPEFRKCSDEIPTRALVLEFCDFSEIVSWGAMLRAMTCSLRAHQPIRWKVGLGSNRTRRYGSDRLSPTSIALCGVSSALANHGI